mmetsp:Transcript_26385/g.62678  ORF Transcript_26385/g.62678 Transcript_26385/m.62678 type:complete len:219 (+) Transcript_26385:123-779(+)
MILEYLPLLKKKRIVLASASPRRRELLNQLGLDFEVKPSSFEEDLPHSNFASAAIYAEETATHKGIDVARQTVDGFGLADVVISSDTVVEFEGKILEKPADAEDAFRVLSLLSGKTNLVHTGVAIVLPNVKGPLELCRRCLHCLLCSLWLALRAKVEKGACQEALQREGSAATLLRRERRAEPVICPPPLAWCFPFWRGESERQWQQSNCVPEALQEK